MPLKITLICTDCKLESSSHFEGNYNSVVASLNGKWYAETISFYNKFPLSLLHKALSFLNKLANDLLVEHTLSICRTDYVAGQVFPPLNIGDPLTIHYRSSELFSKMAIFIYLIAG